MNRSQYAAMFRMLERTRTKWVECIRITRTDGTVYRFTAHDEDLRISDGTPGGPKIFQSAASFSLTNLETNIGLVVSNMNIDAIISDDAITEADLRNGVFEHANVELFLAYWGNNRIRLLPLRTSWIGELQINGSEYKADLRGIAQKLAQVFVSGTSLDCRWSFCDENASGKSYCGLNADSFTDSLVVASVESRDTFTVNPHGNGDDYYKWGKVTFTSGENNGASMEVLRQWGDRFQLFLPLKGVIAPGDTLDALAGCNKTFTQCQAYSNSRRFGGEPYLEGSDVLTRVGIPDNNVSESDVDDGSFTGSNPLN